jgi:hypothetical protein
MPFNSSQLPQLSMPLPYNLDRVIIILDRALSVLVLSPLLNNISKSGDTANLARRHRFRVSIPE